MANAFKQKQDQAKREKLLTDCVTMANGRAGGRMRAIDTYAKGAGVSKEVAERVLADRLSAARMDFRKMFEPR